MEQKTLYFIIISIGLCALGIFVLIFGFAIYKQQELTLNILSFIIFSSMAPPFPSDFFSWFPFYYYPSLYIDLYIEFINLYFMIYTILLETIKESLHPLIISSILPLLGTVTLTFGGIFVALTAINVKQQFVEPSKKAIY